MFKITVKNRSSDENHLSLTLSVSFPSTYPKTIPNLTLSFSDGVLPGARKAAERLIKSKPFQLIGSEMIFEIATALQEILEGASEEVVSGASAFDNIPDLLQERAIHEAEAAQKAKEAEQEENQNQREANEKEQRLLSSMIKQEKARMGNRKIRQPAPPDPFETKEGVPGSLQFDQLITFKNSEGTIATFHTVHDKVDYRKGPVTNIFTVQPLGWPAGRAPFLLLKECNVVVQKGSNDLKPSIQMLESHLNMLKHLAPHPNILKPLNFDIQSSQIGKTLRGSDWHISILSPLATKGSLKDILEAIGSLNIETIRTWAIQLLEGLDFYHRNGIVHAAIHVGNILLEEAEAGNVVVKLSDGVYQHDLHEITCRENENRLKESAIYWTAPELIGDPEAKRVTVTDIWDLGVAIIQMIFGLKITSQQLSPSVLLSARDTARPLDDLLRQMMHPDPKKRKSAFDLKMFEFFRTEEIMLKEIPATQPMIENVGTKFTTSMAVNSRRESVHQSRNHSRYQNDFEEIGRLGRGGYGEVVKVRHKLENQSYAIKKIRQTSASALSKVLSEIVMLSQLNHPNVVRYFTAWTENEDPHRRESFSSGSSSISFTNRDHEELFTRSSGGLDFIGAEPPEIIFSYDDEDDPVALKGIEDSEELQEPGNLSEVENNDSDEVSEGESDQAAAEQLMLRKRRRSSSHDLPTETTLFIQMQYCERQVCSMTRRNKVLLDTHIVRPCATSSETASIQSQKSVGDCFVKYFRA